MGSRDLRRSRDEIFGSSSRGGSCRVCNRNLDDGRRRYCGDYCRDIADAVARLLNWDSVRELVLERDDYTCQHCGLTKEQALRAYHQTMESVDARLPDPCSEDYDLGDRVELNERYNTGMEEWHVDHITPISRGGHPFDPANLQTLCESCHIEKTASENRGAGEAEGVDVNQTLHEFLEDDNSG